MNSHTYTLLRQVGRDIRQQAMEMGETKLAIESLTKAVGYLVAEVHVQGDVTLGTRVAFAEILRAVADSVEHG